MQSRGAGALQIVVSSRRGQVLYPGLHTNPTNLGGCGHAHRLDLGWGGIAPVFPTVLSGVTFLCFPGPLLKTTHWNHQMSCSSAPARPCSLTSLNHTDLRPTALPPYQQAPTTSKIPQVPSKPSCNSQMFVGVQLRSLHRLEPLLTLGQRNLVLVLGAFRLHPRIPATQI